MSREVGRMRISEIDDPLFLPPVINCSPLFPKLCVRSPQRWERYVLVRTFLLGGVRCTSHIVQHAGGNFMMLHMLLDVADVVVNLHGVVDVVDLVEVVDFVDVVDDIDVVVVEHGVACSDDVVS